MKKIFLSLLLLNSISLCYCTKKYGITVSTKADVGYSISGSQAYSISKDTATAPDVFISSWAVNVASPIIVNATVQWALNGIDTTGRTWTIVLSSQVQDMANTQYWLQQATGTFVKKSGDTMTGTLLVGASVQANIMRLNDVTGAKWIFNPGVGAAKNYLWEDYGEGGTAKLTLQGDSAYEFKITGFPVIVTTMTADEDSYKDGDNIVVTENYMYFATTPIVKGNIHIEGSILNDDYAQIKLDTGTLDTNKLNSSSATATYMPLMGTPTFSGSAINLSVGHINFNSGSEGAVGQYMTGRSIAFGDTGDYGGTIRQDTDGYLRISAKAAKKILLCGIGGDYVENQSSYTFTSGQQFYTESSTKTVLTSTFTVKGNLNIEGGITGDGSGLTNVADFECRTSTGIMQGQISDIATSTGNILNSTTDYVYRSGDTMTGDLNFPNNNIKFTNGDQSQYISAGYFSGDTENILLLNSVGGTSADKIQALNLGLVICTTTIHGNLTVEGTLTGDGSGITGVSASIDDGIYMQNPSTYTFYASSISAYGDLLLVKTTTTIEGNLTVAGLINGGVFPSTAPAGSSGGGDTISWFYPGTPVLSTNSYPLGMDLTKPLKTDFAMTNYGYSLTTPSAYGFELTITTITLVGTKWTAGIFASTTIPAGSNYGEILESKTIPAGCRVGWNWMSVNPLESSQEIGLWMEK